MGLNGVGMDVDRAAIAEKQAQAMAMAKSDLPSSPIQSQVKSVFECLTLLSDEASRLEVRLEPVCYPEGASPSDPGNAGGPQDARPSTSELFGDLVQIESQIASITARLGLLAGRLEI